MAIEDCSRAPDYVTKQDHLPTKMDKRTLIPGRRGGGGNHSKLADKGRVCLFVYLWGGGWESRYFTFTFYIYILHFTEAVF